MASSKLAGEVPITWHLGKGGPASSVSDTLPLNPSTETPLASLIDLQSLRALLNDFSALVGIATALLDLAGNVIQFAGWQKACTDFHRHNPRSCANCNESDLYLASNLKEGDFIDYKCKNGLWDVVTPVFVGKQHLANLYCGQFFYDEDVIDDAYFVAQAERFGYDKASYLAAIHAMPRFSREFVRRVMAHIVNLASYLSHLSLTNLKLSESRGQMETLLNTLPDPVWLKDTQGVYLTCNHAFERIIGAPASAIIGKTDYDLFPATLADFFRQKDQEAILASGPNTNEEWVNVAGSEKQALMETTKTALPGASGQPIGVLGIAHDITERKRSEDYLHLMSKVFSNSGEAILITDANKRILAVNQEFTKLTGYSEAEALGKNPKFLACGDTPSEIYQEMWATLAENDYWQGELWDRRKTGEAFPKRLSISVVRDSEGKIVNYIGNFEDITQRKAAEDRIRYLAHHDALTGLPNRFSLHERMEQCIAFAKRDDRSLAVLLIDLDHFKAINDTLGHDVGDQLLIQVAKRLQHSVRDSDIVARLGGDEFVMILSGIEMSTEIIEVAGKIIAQVAAPYSIGSHELRTSPSVGICFYPADATDTGELIKNADIAMYHAKAVGRCNYQFYTEKMRDEVAQRVTVEHELKLALKNGQFVLHYQPQVELSSGKVTGVEALVRWQHPVRGLISPCDFISIAEETKLIIPLGKWILEAACHQLKHWHEEGLSDLHVSVNLSAIQFQDKKLPQMVRQALASSNLDARYLHLEITESMAMQNPDENIVMMKTLANIGVKLAIDDFGTGYSSLAYLKIFPVDIIKIDRSFVKDLETDEDDAAICEITLLLAQKLGVLVVAEGVETALQSQFLSRHDCQWVQGNLYSKPLSAGLVEEYVREFVPVHAHAGHGT
ncbi:EAL domain-containing protein [Janthinobacterium sp. 17J80-10]|uniref:EAL domain-containing protein n=1 Tax=Janthinobacterium sp. 17J80-10 TaxID=2497863 RepID=UPI0010053CC9|nr:EAL domain-containing protein [Janthinobacterium sp. 17J80-10]QAU35612.1 EAL domain-containing protein [Janthinobacterium sp. 17J80-10]